MKLTKLNEEFISQARRPMSFGRLPIDPHKVELPVVPMNRWVKEGQPKKLVKTFEFRQMKDRNSFIRLLLKYETHSGHNAYMFIDEKFVRVELMTKNIEQITEIDKEYAQFADESFKDLMYSTQDSE